MPLTRSARDTDGLIRDVLSRVRRIAVVGLSADPRRPSFGVARFLLARGYAVVGVNPGLAADAVPDLPVYATLAAVPGPVDMVDIFRNSTAVAAVVEEALALDPLPHVVWMQLGVRHEEAARRAEARGVKVVMDRCPAIEIPRLGIIGAQA